ncbi:MAG: metallophosphoesterase family protein [Bryobacteraceae bacterium]
MRYLVLSDIHSNWEALQAALDSAKGQYDRILCCGDLVGYGADPNPVLDWARENVHLVVRGNHDRACAGMENLEWFNPVARLATIWTQGELTQENSRWVRNLPKGPLAVEKFQLIHGSPLHEDEYLVGVSDASQAFPYLETPLVFFGHTHLQGGFMWCRQNVQAIGKPHPPRQSQMLLDLDPDCAYLVNPGSIGQPRDGDSRASYVLFDPSDGFLFYRRVSYDIETAQRKIRNAGLPELLAKRLAVGR